MAPKPQGEEQPGPKQLKQSKLPFKPGPEEGRPRLAPEVAAHVAAEREAEQRRRQDEMAEADGQRAAAAVEANVAAAERGAAPGRPRMQGEARRGLGVARRGCRELRSAWHIGTVFGTARVVNCSVALHIWSTLRKPP
jgi:hypothetical protein